MSRTKKAGKEIADLRGMTLPPLDPEWIQGAAAFHSAEGDIVRARVLILMAAWRGVPAGSLSDNDQYLSSVCGVALERWREIRSVVTEGWVTHKERLYFQPIYELGDRLYEKFGAELDKMSDTLLVAPAAPEEFSLAPVESAAKVARLRTLPADFFLTPELEEYAREKGFDPVVVFDEFVARVRAKNEKYVDWASAFRTHVNNKINWGHTNRSVPALVNARQPAPVMTRKDAVAQRNNDAFNAVFNRRREREVM